MTDDRIAGSVGRSADPDGPTALQFDEAMRRERVSDALEALARETARLDRLQREHAASLVRLKLSGEPLWMTDPAVPDEPLSSQDDIVNGPETGSSDSPSTPAPEIWSFTIRAPSPDARRRVEAILAWEDRSAAFDCMIGGGCR